MNKMLTKLTTTFIGMAMAIGVGVAVSTNNKEIKAANATTTTYRHVFNAKPSTGNNVTLSSVSWSISATNLGSYNGTNYAGVQVGTSKQTSNFEMTSASAWGPESGTYSGKTVVTEIRLWLNAGATGAISTLSASVGGVACTPDTTSITKNSSAGSDWSKATKITFTIGSTNTGNVNIHFGHNDKRALYLCCLEIDCEEPPASIELTSIGLSGTGVSNNAISIGSSDTNAHTINVTLDPTNATDQKVNIAHQSGTNGLFTASASQITCTSGSGSFTITGTGATSGSETFRISGNTETGVYVDLEVTAIDDSTTYYTVTFNSNGGSTTPESKQVEEDGTFEFPSPGTKTHYSFLGWSSDSGTTKYATNATSPAVTADITYTAYWQEDAKYTVTYVKGDHGSGSDYVVNNVYAGSYSLATFATAGFTADSGWAFNKWQIGATQYDAGDSVTISDDTTITAIYAEIVVLTYDKNGGTGTNVTVNYVKGATVTVVSQSFTAPAGKSFSKWNTAADGKGTTYNIDGTFTINKDTTLYAQWAPYLDITIDNFTEITTDYSKTYNHSYTVATHNSTTTMNVQAYGVYNNSNGIQMNSGKGTYIKNTAALPSGAYITSIVCTWTATGKNSPTIYVAKDAVASTSSTKLGKGSNEVTTQTFTVENAATNKYNYFYFDGTTVTGACYLSSLKINYDFYDELSSIAVNATQAQLTYTVGETFTFAGSVTPTRLLSGEGSPTTDNLTFKLGGTSITAGSYVFAKADHGKTLSVTYTEGGVSKSANAPYTVVVNYEDVTSISLNKSAETIGLEGECELTATVLSANADPTVNWAVESEDLVEDTDFECIADGSNFLLTMVEGNKNTGTITVIATATGYVDEEETPDLIATCAITVAGAKSVNLSEDSLSGYAGSGTNHRGSITATANNFSTPTYVWEVVSESASGMITFSASTSATTYVNYVKAGTATIKCGVKENGAGDAIYSDTITVAVSADAVSAVEWETSDITCYSGSALTTDTIDEWAPYFTKLSGDTDFIESDYVVKLDGIAYTLGDELEAGEYEVTLTYGGVTTSSNNPTLTVIQSLHTIEGALDSSLVFTEKCSGSGTADDGKGWSISSDASESTYDSTKGIHYGTSSAEVTYITLSSAAYSTGKITKIVVNASTASGVTATVGVTVGGSQFGGDPKTLTTSATEYTFEGNVDADSIVVTITKSSKAKNALYCKSIVVTTISDIANDVNHIEAQAKVVEFADYFNEQMSASNVCNAGSNVNPSSDAFNTAWGNVADKYSELFGDDQTWTNDPDELKYAKDMLEWATAKWDDSPDCLQRAMKTYEFVVSNYKKTAFMSSVRTATAKPVLLGIDIANNGENILLVIATLTLVAFAFGGYTYFRKKKQF